jgi:hypothetical protein
MKIILIQKDNLLYRNLSISDERIKMTTRRYLLHQIPLTFQSINDSIDVIIVYLAKGSQT